METLFLVFLLAFIVAMTFGLGFADDLLARRRRVRAGRVWDNAKKPRPK
jgi:hypothetical protein